MNIITIIRKPFTTTVAQNTLEHSAGGIHVDACRVRVSDKDDYGRTAAGSDGIKKAHPGFEGKSFSIRDRVGERAEYKHKSGRWPANVLFTPLTQVALDLQSGDLPMSGTARLGKLQKRGKSVLYDGGWNVVESSLPADSGGASRFFMVLT